MSMNSPKFNTSLMSSIPKADVSSGLSLMNGQKNILNAHNAEAEILFLTTCKDSVKLSNVSFSNYLPERFSLHGTTIETCLCKLCKDPDILQHNLTSIDFNRTNGDRIKNILTNILGKKKVEKYLEVVYETYLNFGNMLDQRGKFRVFLIYAISNSGDSQNEKNWLAAFLFDPFHLVCPVGNKETNREEAMKKEYHHVKDYNENFGTVFEEEFKNIDFKKLNVI